MAKRRRLTPPNPDLLLPDALTEDADFPVLETKSMFPMGVARTVTRPPIAQVAGEASALAALEGLSAAVTRARTEGRIVEDLTLAQIATDHLVRDRMVSDDAEMEALIASLRARGQQTPVEVLDRGEGTLPRYGLISGWRRIAGLRKIAQDNGDDPAQTQVLAIIRQPKTAADAYLAMVEENEIRADISFYERARIVVKALEQGVFEDQTSALRGLFGNVSRAKRSKIKSFLTIVTALDGALRFPAALSEKAGLDLVRRIEADAGFAPRLIARLELADPQTPDAELKLLAAPESPTAPPPRAAPDLALDVSADAQGIRISGAGIDDALIRDLKRWLAKRQSAH